jgi:hypothetical protein
MIIPREYITVVLPDGTKKKFKTVYGEYPYRS